MTLDPSALRFDRPTLALDRVAEVLWEHWGIRGGLRQLEGERDQNIEVTTPDGRRHVLKIASPSEDPAAVDLQCAVLRHVAAAAPELRVPRVVPAADGSEIVSTTIDAGSAPTRLVTFLEGETFGGVRLGAGDLGGIGATLGRLTAALHDFTHPAASGFMAWSFDAGLVTDPDLWDGLSPEGRAVALPLRDRLDGVIASLDGLPRQVVHHDAHRGNLLRDRAGGSNDVVGVIDFGDATHSWVASDVAVCVGGVVDWRDAHDAAPLVAGYDTWTALSPAEIGVLVDLVRTRMVLGLLLVEFQARHAPPGRLDEIAGELPDYRAAIDGWAAVDTAAVTDAIHAAVDARRAAAGTAGATGG